MGSVPSWGPGLRRSKSQRSGGWLVRWMDFSVGPRYGEKKEARENFAGADFQMQSGIPTAF